MFLVKNDQKSSEYLHISDWNVLRSTTLRRNPSKVQSHVCANDKPFYAKTQINLIFLAKDLYIPNFCCTFAASKVKERKTTMEATVRQSSVFNPIQIHLLKMFSVDKAEQGLIELKDVLYNYYSKKMQNRLDELWDNGTLDQARLDEINQMDLHHLD